MAISPLFTVVGIYMTLAVDITDGCGPAHTSRPKDRSYNLRVRGPPAMHVTTIMILIDETAVSIGQ